MYFKSGFSETISKFVASNWKMDLSVVIVNYNVRYFLEQCLHSVLRAAEGRQVEIYVVDNHSSDDSVNYLQPLFPSVIFIQNRVNEGFARANNQVIPLLKGEFVLFLNPDTLIPEDCFEKCIAFIRSKKDAGAIGVKMMDGSGRFLPESKRNLPSPVSSLIKLSGLGKLFQRKNYGKGYYDCSIAEHESGPVQILSGAFMFMRKTLLYEVEGFDADFFMYGEDIDLSYRICLLGYRNYYLGSCAIIHFKGESSVRNSPTFTRNFYGAMALFVKKHYSGTKAMLLFAGIQFSRVLALSMAGWRSGIGRDLDERERVIKITGNTEDVSRALALLKKSGIKFMEATHDMYFDTLLIHTPHTDYARLIAMISEAADRYEIWISATGSGSIIGSRKRHQNGMVIS